MITRRPILALIPVLVDVVLLMTPGLRSEALSSQAYAYFTRAVTISPSGPDALLAAGVQLGEVRDGVANWNLLGVLAWQVPTLSGPVITLRESQAVRTARSLGATLGLLALLASGSLLLAGLYLGRVADAVRAGSAGAAKPGGEATTPPPEGPLPTTLRRMTRNVARLTGLRAIQGAILAALAALGIGAFATLPVVGTSIALLAVLAAFVLVIFLFVAEEAIFLGGATAWAAVRESARIVRGCFGAMLGMWVLIGVIGVGLRLVWFAISSTTAGALAAMLGNAYVVTGLTAAVFVFYGDRAGHASSAGSGQALYQSPRSAERRGS
ncbi:MAG: hypothetical protein EXR47_00050 [Dehalococcoidia bacterium]|nr:hypothetical protein [Dehalococcoidia bacterium]